jgi:hypothetical protein
MKAPLPPSLATAQTQLAGDLFGCQLVDLEGVLLLVVGLGPDAAVDVHDVQRFRRFDDQIRPLLERDHLPERTLDLAADFEMVEDRFLAFVEFDDFLLLRRDQGNILLCFLVDLDVVHMYVGERFVQKVPEDGGGFGILREEQAYTLVLGDPLPGAFPLFDERAQFSDQYGGVLAFRGGTDDGSVILGKNAPDERFKPFFLFL